ncbi:MAG TPA: hypothetical protein VFN67_07370, partial [Polyangiales bacterium]|nr:hypothetical protein [Polyangiales bacterium]
DAPSIRVKTLTVTRAGRVQFVMHAFRKSLDGSWDRSQAEWVECPADASLELRTLDMRVVPGWGKLSAILAQGPRTHVALRLEGRRLDGLKPRVVTELEPVAQPTNKLM